MPADLTRDTFDPLKHFSRVVMQQGRVQLDSDWNEQSSILLHCVRRLAADLYGPAGGPPGRTGFVIEPVPTTLTLDSGDFFIGPGNYYVDGILCELEATPLAIKTPLHASGEQVTLSTLTVDGRQFRKGQYVFLFDWTPGVAVTSKISVITGIDYSKRTLNLRNVKDFTTGAKQPKLRRIVSFLTQPDVPKPELEAGLVYLDVWERVVTCVEDDAMREVALNGPDTAVRTKVVWQVKILKNEDKCLSPQELADRLQPATRGLLKAKARPAPKAVDPCTIHPDAKYRGLENQLYRVEIHTGSESLEGKETVPTFKWSRENGAVPFPILGGGGTNTLVLATLGRDDRFGLAKDDWVEIEDDDSVLEGRVAPLLQVVSINRSRMTVVLAGTPPTDIGRDLAKHPRLRRWDHEAGDASDGELTLGSDNAALIRSEQDKWLHLEDGVEIMFVDSASATYRTGDCWLIPARIATGDVEWPRETIPGEPPTHEPVALLPHGVTHHYASLATITVDGKLVKRAKKCQLSRAMPPELGQGIGPGASRGANARTARPRSASRKSAKQAAEEPPRA